MSPRPSHSRLPTAANNGMSVSHPAFKERVTAVRDEAIGALDTDHRSELGQFFTPFEIAEFMASMPDLSGRALRILDPGAGSGMLTAAVVSRLAASDDRPKTVHVVAFEVDPGVAQALSRTLGICGDECKEAGIKFSTEVRSEDFIEAASRDIAEGHSQPLGGFDLAILNPPYKKLHSESWHRALLREAGIETSNLYTAFVSLAVRCLRPSGELVAITPRSFCNGTYFRQFRHDLLSRFRFKRIHVFERRDAAFHEDSVLQENIIFYGVRSTAKQGEVVISSSNGRGLSESRRRSVPASEVVHPTDREAFIHIVPDEADEGALQVVALKTTLRDLGLSVSTGPVVDFRAKEWLKSSAGSGDAPLIYPYHFQDGFVQWPRGHAKKPSAIAVNDATAPQLVGAGTYVLVKRFSAKEERRRVTAAIFDPDRVPAAVVGIENHLNFFHASGAGLVPTMARGLAAFLNSTAFDAYFRRFSGHTQVNATDLRNARYPTRAQLIRLGEVVGDAVSEQADVDDAVTRVVFGAG